MPNVVAVFKEEIVRLARKELRSNTDPLKKAIARYRSQIAALKRRIEQLERQVKRVGKTPAANPQEDAEDDASYRWRADGFAKHRQRLGLSAAEMGKLLGVSQLSVYKWESGKARPRARYLPAIAELRTMGKREAVSRVEKLGT